MHAPAPGPRDGYPRLTALRRIAVVLLLCGLLPAAAGAQREPIRELRGPFPVLEVIDGDTVRIRSDLSRRSVRLIGIDAPEVAHPERGREPFGHAATDFVRERLPPGTEVWVEVDGELEDAYGRLLAYLYRKHPEGDWHVRGERFEQVNLAIARAGYARPLTIPPNVQYADLFARAAEGARAEGLGMWSDEPEVARTDGGTPSGAAADGRTSGSRAGRAEAAPPGDVRIACALYDPHGDDRGTEWISLEIFAPTDTRGMFLFDEGSRSTFPLPPGLQEPGRIRIDNPGQGVWNNGGDVVYLMRGDDVVDSWDYSSFDAGQGDVVCRF